ncbi:MAG: SurA N-terminal domain-containing protein [Candidatus Chisholmbacteria bacterium]|nr:SurA N-terminal domain-containing protein [Candidatus Chisholmbacteria bacterium]
MAARKRSTRRRTRRSRRSSNVLAATTKNPESLQFSLDYVKKHQLKSGLIGALVIIALLLAFPLRFLVVSASVNGQPIYSWQYLSQLNKSAGSQTINQLISQKLIEQEIQKQGVQVTQAEIDAQMAQIESQFGEEGGGLDTVLAAQGLTRAQFTDQIRLNLGLEKLIKGTIQVTPEEIQAELTKNAELYESLSEADSATTAAENLRNDKMQAEFQTWFQKIKAEANIKINLPLPASPDLGV